MGKSCLVIYPASGPFVALSKICDQESRAADFSYDFVFNFIDVVLPINAEGVETGVPDSGFDAMFIRSGSAVVEPHSDERLGRVNVSCLVCDVPVSSHCNIAIGKTVSSDFPSR